MESVKQSEANSCHHPNKVAVNSLPTETNKHASGSALLNNNKLGINQQLLQVQLPAKKIQEDESKTCLLETSSSSNTISSSSSGVSNSSESKDTNFEYDDNEWDVGGIGDLIIDLDADIEKSSSTVTTLPAQPSQQQSQDHQSASIAISGVAVGAGNPINDNQILGVYEKSANTSSVKFGSSSSSNLAGTSATTKSNFSSLLRSIPSQANQQFIPHQYSISNKQESEKSSSLFSSENKPLSSIKTTAKSENLKVSQNAAGARFNSNSLLPQSESPSHTEIENREKADSNSSRTSPGRVEKHTVDAMSSQQGSGQGAGKTGTKMSIDHQATLDKGLKMKIKRTKPGTKTSEAKHEIVKAEQNGNTSSLDDSNVSSNNSQGSKKHAQNLANQVQQPVQQSQSTKRGSSSHRRDKTRDKVTHSREKADHSSTSGCSNNNSNSSSNLSSSNTNSSSVSDRLTGSCNCHHDMQINGAQTICTSASCLRNRNSSESLDSSNPLAQRISISSANQSNNANTISVNATSSLPSSVSSTGTTSTSALANSNSGTNFQPSTSTMPNAPGPPKDIKHGSSSSASGGVQLDQQVTVPGSNATNSHNVQHQSDLGAGTSSTTGHTNQSNLDDSNTLTPISATVHHTIQVAANCSERTTSPPAKKHKCDSKEMIDICVGTSVGTVTEPDCLGPCEPGTSVTLEGIVWHETEGGVLVVNVTWRGKTYVGTLLDCTRHDWAPPRFCDSPTEELDSRNPKGRGKRGRSTTLAPDLSNFTETRSSVHSKLRNGGAKGRGGRGVSTSGGPPTATTTSTSTTSSSVPCNTSSTTTTSTPSTSPTAFLHPRTEKRKSKEDSPSPVNVESPNISAQSLVNPMTGLNVQISTKRCRTTSPSAVSPVLLECPEQDCSKKYKHANGLRYHQSHAHGSTSMDEDSLQLPESPRAPPPTTPSPAPATVPQSKSVAAISNVSTVPQSSPMTSVSSPSAMSTSMNSSTTTQQKVTAATISNPSVEVVAACLRQSASVQIPTVASPIATQIPCQISQLPVPGGSITSGISGQALSQHQQQQNTTLTGPTGNGAIANSGGSASDVCQGPNQSSLLPHTQQQQQQQAVLSGDNVSDSQLRPIDSQIKASVLCFGSTPDNMLANQDTVRSATAGILSSNSGSTEVQGATTHQSAFIASSVSSQQGVSNSKPQGGYAKQKKNRSKSPVVGDFDNSVSRENVQSPAYSDISDDSTPVAEPEVMDKSHAVKHSDVKKSQESGPPPISSLGGYGVYQFYPQQQYMMPSDVQVPKPSTVSQSSLPLTSPDEYSKSKDPPLDLMTKSVHASDQTSKDTVVSSQNPVGPPQNPNKPIPYFYPHNYLTAGYPYNIDSNYGPISMVSEDNKFNTVPTVMKEERGKDNLSPGDHGKLQISSKLPKPEAQLKEVKTESNTHVIQPKEPPLNPYPGIYQRHPIGASPQTSQHLSREDDMRRFYIYPDQRRDSLPGNAQSNVPPITIKDEQMTSTRRPITHSSTNISHVQQMHQHLQSSIQSQSAAQQQQQQQQQQQLLQKCGTKSNMPGSQNSSSSQKATNLVKDSKDDKDIKVKQEGQKPTMETQGPPPPPTSQYFLHPQYLAPNFSFDPAHPMYRNVLMSASPYNPSPYHLPIPRFHAPEDLSRNSGPKALDVLQQAANTMQYYGGHKIHELSERALKSPNNNTKTSVSSPNIPQPNVPSTVSGSNISGAPSGMLQVSSGSAGPLNLQPASGAISSNIGGATGTVGMNISKSDGKSIQDSSNKGPTGTNTTDSRSPPPQRHVHTHHHTHVGLGYPMYTAPYGAAVLASQQAAAVAAINPFPPGPTK